MFGFPTWYVGKKLCIFLYEQGVGVKLPEASIKQLLESNPHAIPFHLFCFVIIIWISQRWRGL